MRVLYNGKEQLLCEYLRWSDCYVARFAVGGLAPCGNLHAWIVRNAAKPLTEEARVFLDSALAELALLRPIRRVPL